MLLPDDDLIDSNLGTYGGAFKPPQKATGMLVPEPVELAVTIKTKAFLYKAPYLR